MIGLLALILLLAVVFGAGVADLVDQYHRDRQTDCRWRQFNDAMRDDRGPGGHQ